MQNFKLYCNFNFTDWKVLREKWEKSFPLRVQEKPTFESWLCLKQALGYNLVRFQLTTQITSPVNI